MKEERLMIDCFDKLRAERERGITIDVALWKIEIPSTMSLSLEAVPQVTVISSRT
jgi:translation elongation factor EF-1alpha